MKLIFPLSIVPVRARTLERRLTASRRLLLLLAGLTTAHLMIHRVCRFRSAVLNCQPVPHDAYASATSRATVVYLLLLVPQ